MAAVVSTLVLSPLSSSPDSGATVTDTHTSVRVTAAVAPEHSASQQSGTPSLRVAPSTAREGGARAERINSSRRCSSARTGLAFYRSRQRDWNALRGVPSRIGRKPHGCADARYLASIARERASIARRAHGRWLERRTLRDFEVRAGSSAWLRAVQEAQRAYPNTSWWLHSCSASEGGHGRWVPNSDGAPPGGWMQFYESTFWRMWSTAKVDVERRGFRVPRSAASWYSPLGQALAGGWAITHGMRHHWAGTGC